MSSLKRENSDHIVVLEKAFRLLQMFSHDVPTMSISEAARRADVTRPSARRILLTCVNQGLMETDGKDFWLTPKIMRLGYGYLSTLPYWESAQRHMRHLADAVGESCSLATLDGNEIVYLTRISERRGTIPLGVGSRLPVHATSLGKALISFAEPDVLASFVETAPFEKLTPDTITTAADFQKEVDKIRTAGYAMADGEREIGIRSIAVPVRTRSGRVVAALNISANSLRVSKETMLAEYLPQLSITAKEISTDLGYTTLH